MLSHQTEAGLRAAIVRFIDGVKNTTGDHMAKVEARDESDTDDGCRRMMLTVSWSDRMGNTRHAVRTFATEPRFSIDRFRVDLDTFGAHIRDKANASAMVH